MKKFLICSMIAFSFLLISCGKEEKATTDTKEEKMIIINNIKPVEKEEPEVEETKGEVTENVVNVDKPEPIEQETEDPVVEPAEEPTDPGEVDIEKFNKDGVYDLDAYAKALGYILTNDPYDNGIFYVLNRDGENLFIYKTGGYMHTGFNRDGVYFGFELDDEGHSDNESLLTTKFGEKNAEETELFINDECSIMSYYATTPLNSIDLYSFSSSLLSARVLDYRNIPEEWTEDGIPKGKAHDTDISKGLIKARGEQ